jgi:hypothetical protein
MSREANTLSAAENLNEGFIHKAFHPWKNNTCVPRQWDEKERKALSGDLRPH